MSPERRTDILLLIAMAVIHLSLGSVAKLVAGSSIIGWIATIGYFVIMFTIYWRFNRERSSIVQTVSYWSIFVLLVLTQRFALVVERTDILAGTALRLTVFAPIYLYWVVTKD